MVVRKKILDSQPTAGTMNLSRHLTQVRAAIKTLPTDEQEQAMQNDPSTATASEPGAAASTVKKKVAPKKKPPAKKAATKKAVKKTPAPASNQVILADVAKEMKIEPRAARRILRTAKIKNPGRWAWDKGSAGLAAAKKALKEATSD